LGFPLAPNLHYSPHNIESHPAQPAKLTRSWIATIIEQQSEIRSLIENIPSLGRQADAIAESAYPNAVRRVARETGLRASSFPATLTWAVAPALAFDLPEPPAPKSRRG
jgi:hypothetical protein